MGTARRSGAELCAAACVHDSAVTRARSRLKDDDIYIGLAELFGGSS